MCNKKCIQKISHGKKCRTKKWPDTLTTFVDNGKYLAAITWTVIEIEWSSALLDMNVQLGASWWLKTII